MSLFVILNLKSSDNTAWHERVGVPFKGPIYQLGCIVECTHITDKCMERTHTFGNKLLEGIFVGCHQQTGCGWSGDLCLVNKEGISQTEHVYGIHMNRLKASRLVSYKITSKTSFKSHVQRATSRNLSQTKPIAKNVDKHSSVNKKIIHISSNANSKKNIILRQ